MCLCATKVFQSAISSKLTQISRKFKIVASKLLILVMISVLCFSNRSGILTLTTGERNRKVSATGENRWLICTTSFVTRWLPVGCQPSSPLLCRLSRRKVILGDGASLLLPVSLLLLRLMLLLLLLLRLLLRLLLQRLLLRRRRLVMMTGSIKLDDAFLLCHRHSDIFADADERWWRWTARKISSSVNSGKRIANSK